MPPVLEVETKLALAGAVAFWLMVMEVTLEQPVVVLVTVTE
jgi:hypothetical protein